MLDYFDLKVGFTCNNNCVHCVVTDKKDTKDLTTQEIKNTIDSLPVTTMVGFTGGEATIRTDFLELLAYAKKTGHQTFLQTNGVRFADRDFAVDVSRFLDGVLIAIHSHEASVHDSIVRVQGMYRETVEGFKNIVKLRIPCSTQTVISKLNVENLVDTYDFIQSIKPGIMMSLTFPHPNGNAWTNADIVVPRYTDIKPFIHTALAKYSHLLRTEAIPMCYLYPYQDEVYNFDEHILDDDRQGLDPANKNKQFFNEIGVTRSYALSMIADKRKGPLCADCIFNDRCVGVWKEYVDLHGKHFDLFPVTKDNDKLSIVCDCTQEEAENTAINTSWGALILHGTTGNCMNKCAFCTGTHKLDDPSAQYELYMEEAKHFISTGVTQIEISGGDPGEYPHLLDIVRYLRNNNVKEIQLSTHGRTLKNAAFVQELKQAGITRVKVPLYGSNATIHNQTAQFGPSDGDAFTDSIEGIKNCVACDIPVIGYTLINRINKEDINNIIQLYLDITQGKLTELLIGLAFLAHLNYEYTDHWYLPIKELGPYVRQVLDNHPPIPSTVERFGFLDIPYCVFGKYTDLTENKFAGFPNLGKHKIEEENRSDVSDQIPHYRIKSYFGECVNCDLQKVCGGVPLNEIKMFGVYGLKAVKEALCSDSQI